MDQRSADALREGGTMTGQRESITTFGIKTEKLLGILLPVMIGVIAWAVRVEVRLDKSPTNAEVRSQVSEHASDVHRGGASVTALAHLRTQISELNRREAKLTAVLTSIQTSISDMRQDLRELRRQLSRRRGTRRATP